MNYFHEARQRVSAKDAASRYGVEINRYGKARCPFHNERTPSMGFKGGRYHCFGCGASGDSIDLVSRLFGLEPKEALSKLNRDFGLCLPLDRDPTPEETQTARRRRSIDRAHKEFEEWRKSLISRLSRVCLLAHMTLKDMPDKLTEQEIAAIQSRAWAEYLADTLSYGAPEDQLQIFRDRQVIEPRIERILKNTLTKSGAA